MKTYYLAIDIETSGPSMVHHFIPCFGAALIDVDTLVAEHVRLFWIAQPDNTTWDDATIAEFWSKARNATWYREILDRQASGTLPSLQTTMREFVDWVRNAVAALDRVAAPTEDNAAGQPHVRIVSDNPSFDLGWLSYYLALGTDGAVPHVQYLIRDRFMGAALDTHSFADGLCRRLRAPHLTAPGSYAQPHTSVWHTLGIAEWRRHVFAANHASHDHHPENDAVAIGLSAALVTRAALDMCRLHDGVPLRSQYDTAAPPSLAMYSMVSPFHRRAYGSRTRSSPITYYDPPAQPPLVYNAYSTSPPNV